MTEYIELKPLINRPSDYDGIERKIKLLIKKALYYPILKILGEPQKRLVNSIEALPQAIQEGRIVYAGGQFTGKLDAFISRELRGIGAKWNRQTQTYHMPANELPYIIKIAISTGEARLQEKADKIDTELASLDPAKIADKLDIVSDFSKALRHADKHLDESFKSFTVQKSKYPAVTLKRITIPPDLSENMRHAVATDWQNNMKLWVQKFTEEQIVDLRKMVQANVYAGNRMEALHAPIEKMLLGIDANWGKVESKAKFLARQETNLLMARYKQEKCEDAGVPRYKWATVKMPYQPSPKAPYKAGEVRYSHAILEGKVFSWSDPPVTTAPNQPQRRNNPGADFGCRCFCVPVLEIIKKSPTK